LYREIAKGFLAMEIPSAAKHAQFLLVVGEVELF
jgi:hypothetical protein